MAKIIIFVSIFAIHLTVADVFDKIKVTKILTQFGGAKCRN